MTTGKGSTKLKTNCSGCTHIAWENNVDVLLWQHAIVYSKDDISAYINGVFCRAVIDTALIDESIKKTLSTLKKVQDIDSYAN